MFNFMELSPSYLKHVTTSVRMRRNFVCEHYLGEDYDLKEHGHSTAAAVQELRAQGIEASRTVIQVDAKMFRTAFDYLQSTSEKQVAIRDEMEGISSHHGRPTKFFGVKCLIDDNISTLADIERLKSAEPSPEPAPEAGAEEVKIERELTVTAGAPSDVAVELPVSTAIDVKLLASKATSSLAETLATTQALIDQLMADRERLTQRVEFLGNQNSLLQAELATQAQAAEQSRAQVQEWQRHGEELLAEVDAIHTKTLIELAQKVGAQSEAGREVLRAVQRFAEDQKRRQAVREEQTAAEALSGVVVKGRYMGLRVVPEPKFVQDFLALQNSERKAVEEAMKRFREEGPLYPSFQSHVITDDTVEGLPPKSFTSRASDELRLVWRQEEDGIHFYRIIRKGDRAFFKSEA